MNRTLKGFANINKQMKDPESRNRPKIAQMPTRRRNIGISKKMNLEGLKMPGLRKRKFKL